MMIMMRIDSFFDRKLPSKVLLLYGLYLVTYYLIPLYEEMSQEVNCLWEAADQLMPTSE